MTGAPLLDSICLVLPKAADAERDVTGLLEAWAGGDVDARDRLMEVVYRDLKRRAAAQLRGERRGDSLQATALVHEAYLRLVDQHVAWRNRGHFFGIASQMMRRILVDRARRRKMGKRSGRWQRITLREMQMRSPIDLDVLDLDAALTRLAQFDARKCQLAELRFFGGLSLQEASEALDISIATAMRDWQAARAWLFKELKRKSAS